MTDVKKSDENRIGAGKPGPGRPKGMPNKTTALLKDAILKAAENAGGDAGVVGYLTVQAKENPGPFMTLLGKVLPTQIVGDPDSPIVRIQRVELVPVEPSPLTADGRDTSRPVTH